MEKVMVSIILTNELLICKGLAKDFKPSAFGRQPNNKGIRNTPQFYSILIDFIVQEFKKSYDAVYRGRSSIAQL